MEKLKSHLNKLPLLVALGCFGWAIWPNAKERDRAITVANNVFLGKDSRLCTVKPGSVYDGDTLRVICNGKELKIRMCGIDAPERDQPLGVESRDTLRSLLPDGREVYLVRAERDRYGRVVGEIFVPGTPEIHANSEMALRGMAYAYREYISTCPNGQAILTGEMLAQEKKVGVWSGDYELPSEFRRKNRK